MDKLTLSLSQWRFQTIGQIASTLVAAQSQNQAILNQDIAIFRIFANLTVRDHTTGALVSWGDCASQFLISLLPGYVDNLFSNPFTSMTNVSGASVLDFPGTPLIIGFGDNGVFSWDNADQPLILKMANYNFYHYMYLKTANASNITDFNLLVQVYYRTLG